MWSWSRLWKDKIFGCKEQEVSETGFWLLGLIPEGEQILVGGDISRQGSVWMDLFMKSFSKIVCHGLKYCKTQPLYLAVVSVALKKWTSFNKSSIFCMSSWPIRSLNQRDKIKKTSFSVMDIHSTNKLSKLPTSNILTWPRVLLK